MNEIIFSDVYLVNAAPVDTQGVALGCQGFVLYGNGFAEIHTVTSGFSRNDNDGHYLVVSKSVLGTCDGASIQGIIKHSLELTGTRYASDFVGIPLTEWLGGFVGASGKSLDLLSSQEADRRLGILSQDSFILFTVVGSRIRVELQDGAGKSLPLGSGR